MASEMHRYMVSERGFMSAGEFADNVALAQIAPGPNILFVTLLGLQAAGPWGAVATTFGILTPSSLITFYLFRVRNRYANTPLVKAIAIGLVPLAVGLIASTGVTLSKSSMSHWAWGVAIAATVVCGWFYKKVNPLWWLALGALVGVSSHMISYIV